MHSRRSRISPLKSLATFACCIGLGICAQAQPPNALPPLISPQVLPDHRVVFRIRAPKATEVTVDGDFFPGQADTGKLTRDADGVWSLTTAPLTPNYYSYFFTIDGVHLPDPVNGLTKPGVGATQSAFLVPGPQPLLLEATSVPHGEVRTVYYQAASLAKPSRMHIYFPPGYDAAKTRYPVVYLFHGSGDDDGAWESIGRVNFILDNLIAQGKAKPMLVVMPSLWAIDPPVPASRATENETLFRQTLIQDIIPYVEAHYRVMSGRVNRAAGGLGLGREFLPDVVWPSLDQFNSFLFVSGGADSDRFALLQKKYPGVIDDAANIKNVRFFLGDGVNDRSYPSATNLSDELKRRGYKVVFVSSENTHGWPEFRYNFEQFAQTAFR